MRILVFFDLPSVTSSDRKAYSKFRKHLVNSGFMMMQESVYCKLALNMTVANSIMNSVRANKPPKGLIQMMVVTENQYSRMEYVLGEQNTQVINSCERLIVL